MKSCEHKIGYHVGYPTMAGVTLVEIIIVVAIIAILVTMVIGIAARIDTQGKEHLTKNTLALLDAALSQFQDFGYEYKFSNYAGLDFPLDCNGFSDSRLNTVINNALGTTPPLTINPAGAHTDPNDLGCEMMYFFLNMVPESRKTLDKIDKSLITSKASDGREMTITIDGKDYPLFRVTDPWGMTLRYDYYNERGSATVWKSGKKTFPVITSVGPDKVFRTNDDISSR